MNDNRQSLGNRCQDIWEKIRYGPARLPSQVIIPCDHVEKGAELDGAFQPGQHYFQVIINEMYLAYSRKWFSTYDPMVFVVAEFIYDKKRETVPFVVGPMMIKKMFGQETPTGTIFLNTRVAGAHPYCGGGLTLYVVLCQVKCQNYVQKLLQMVENTANVLDFSSALNIYLKVAGILLDGIETLLGSGDITPIIGSYKQFNPDAGERLKPGYFALIDLPESQLDTSQLWVRDDRLVYGQSLTDAQPFRAADYVLYSITQTAERNEVRTLPFYPLWERVAQEAMVPKEANWQSAKSNMVSLYQTMRLSPDLTEKHAEKLANEYVEKMMILHNRAVDLVTLGSEEEVISSALEVIRAKALAILES